MLYYEHESLFTRSAAACPPMRGSRNIPSRDCENIRGLGSDDQTLSQTTTRDRSGGAKSDSRSSCQKRSDVAGQLESAVRSSSRCHARRALSPVPSRTWHRGESCQHQSCQSGAGLDTKKKSLAASERREEERARWREQVKEVDDCVAWSGQRPVGSPRRSAAGLASARRA